MPIIQLQLTNLRNIRAASLTPAAGINLIFGDNGSGKTSLLEGIHVLGLARSFRSTRHIPLISYGEEEATVFAEIQEGERRLRLGVAKNRSGETALRLDTAPLQSAAELAHLLPLLSLNSSSFELINGPPKPRRRLLDWVAFHVEPAFLAAWRNLQHCLKQRNMLLRRGKISGSELAPWDLQLAQYASQIDDIRQHSMAMFSEAFAGLGDLLPGVGEVKLYYQRGWHKDCEYRQALEEHLEQDLLRGYTQVGPHRADIKISVNNGAASELLSRGQQKIVTCALLLAQGVVFTARTGRPCTYLIDDLPSELDSQRRQQLARWLVELGAQLFITGIELEPLLDMWPQNIARRGLARFHVEHGQIRQEYDNNT